MSNDENQEEKDVEYEILPDDVNEVNYSFKIIVIGDSAVGKSSLTLKGTKEVVKVEINAESLDKDDIEALQDMIVVAMNDANKKIDSMTEDKMGKFSSIPGLF